VGLLLGAQGKVVDLEIDDPDAARDALARLFPDGLPETLGWYSNRGWHRLFLFDPRLAKFGTPIIKGPPHYSGLELRIGAAPGERKQFQSVIPPSQKADGTPRQWFGPWVILPLLETVFEDLERHVLIPCHRPTTDGPALRNHANIRTSYGRGALQREAEIVAGTPEGNRRNQLNKSAFSLGQLIGAGVLDEDVVITTLTEAALKTGLPPKEIDKTIWDGIEDGKAKPRNLRRLS
jgi:hypothetical protein